MLSRKIFMSEVSLFSCSNVQEYVWLYCYVVMFLCGYVHMWLCSCVVMHICGYASMWLCAYVVMLQCGYVHMWLCACMAVFICCHVPVWLYSQWRCSCVVIFLVAMFLYGYIPTVMFRRGYVVMFLYVCVPLWFCGKGTLMVGI